VNLALLKAELLHARIRERGLGIHERLFSSIDLMGRIGTLVPSLANAAMKSFLLRTALYKLLGLAWQRPLPNFARRRFDHWFNSRKIPAHGARGKVLLWDDTFVRYYEPHIGIAAVKVLEAAGFEVGLVKGRKCCGRPAFSQGHLRAAFESGLHNVQLLAAMQPVPILFLEPSCYSMFVDDYRELRVPGAEQMAARCFLFEQFLEGILTDDPNALHFRTRPGKVVIHAHCHLKALMSPAFLRTLALRLPGREVHLLDSACCGMAGAFGALEAKYELSLKVAEPLAQQIRSQPYGTSVIASGASCRHQLEHLTPLHARHMAELLAEAVQESE
jgi:Fe-S oxidoreductase